MKIKLYSYLVLLAWLAGVYQAVAQGTTAFSYQGRLENGGVPTSGVYDFQFSLSNAPAGGSQIGNIVTNLAVNVTNGLFNTMLDFGPVFTGNATWLAIGVRTNGAVNFAGLQPLQPFAPVPYAMYAANAARANSVPASNIVGSVSLTQLPGTVLTNNASGVNLSGTFSGDGTGLFTVTGQGFARGYDTGNHLNSVAGTFRVASFFSYVLVGWGSDGSTFTCTAGGTYLMEYTAEAATSVSSPTTVCTRIYNVTAGSEVVGTEASVIVSTANQPTVITKSFVASISPGTQLQFQFTGSSSSAELLAGIGYATTQPSISFTFVRLQ